MSCFGRSKERRHFDPLTPKKVLVLGDGHVGKTRLVERFSTGQFKEALSDITRETDVLTAENTYEGSPIQLVIYDTPGQEDYSKIRQLAYPQTDVILLCFDLTSHSTLENIVESWTMEIKHVKRYRSCPFILVGTKSDERNRRDLIKREKMNSEFSDVVVSETLPNGEDPTEFVTRKEGMAVSDKIGAFVYLECSAKSGAGVREVFNVATLIAVQHNKWNKRLFRKLMPRWFHDK